MFAVIYLLEMLVAVVWGTFVFLAHVVDAIVREILGEPQPRERW